MGAVKCFLHASTGQRRTHTNLLNKMLFVRLQNGFDRNLPSQPYLSTSLVSEKNTWEPDRNHTDFVTDSNTYYLSAVFPPPLLSATLCGPKRPKVKKIKKPPPPKKKKKKKKKKS